MKSFYEMMKLVEDYPGAQEDFGDEPSPEEDTQGMGAAEMGEDPMGGMLADFPALAQAAQDNPQVAEELERLFSTMTPPDQGMEQQPQNPMGAPPAGGTPPQDGVPFMRKMMRRM